MEREELSDKSFSLDILSRQRGALMGLATLNVMLLHIFQVFELLGSKVLFYVFESGADIFMLMSGFGLYFSLAGKPDLRGFYKKRFLRLFPEYLLSILFFTVILGFTPWKIFLHITTLSFWIDRDLFFWYIAVTAVLYIIYPLIHRAVSKSGTYALLLIVITVIANIVFALIPGDYFALRTIAFNRIPVFITGALIAREVKTGRRLKKDMILILVIVAMASLIPAVFLPVKSYRLFFLPWAAAVSVIAAYLFDWTREKNIFRKGLELLGGISLQVYLLHGAFSKYLYEKAGGDGAFRKVVLLFVTTVLTLILAVILRKICDLIRSIPVLSQKPQKA